MRSTLRALVALILAAVRGTVVTVRLAGRDALLDPRRLRVFPIIAGADGEDDEDTDDDDDTDTDDVDDTDDDDTDDTDPPADDFDRDRAMRTIREQREREKTERKARKAAEKRARDLEARVSELEAGTGGEDDQQRIARERDDAKAAAAAAKTARDNVLIRQALMEAALDANVDPKKLKRAVKLADRDGIEVDDDGDVDGAEDAIAELLEDFPEFVRPGRSGEDDDEDQPRRRRESSGGRPDRKRRPKPLTPDQVAQLAADNPDEFNRRFEAGEFTPDQLGG